MKVIMVFNYNVAELSGGNIKPNIMQLLKKYGLGNMAMIILVKYKSLEIDIETYFRLQEIALFGRDSTAGFLLDQIPNLSYFHSIKGALYPYLESEQHRLTEVPKYPACRRAELHYRMMEQLEREGDSGYRLSGRFRGGTSA